MNGSTEVAPSAARGERSGERPNGSRIAVVDKAVRVLDVLMLEPSGLTPTDVAAGIATNRSTAFRLLTSLEQSGLLERDGSTGRYRLGVKLLQYSETVRASTALVDLAGPILRRLAAQARQSVSLAIREGFGARCIHRIPGPEVEVFAWKIGDWMPLHAGAAPQALLGTLSDAEVERFLSQPGERRTRHGVLAPSDIRSQIETTRSRGWSLNLAGLTPGVNSLGAAVRDGAGAPVCAISVAGLDHHYRHDTVERTAAVVVAAAAELGELFPA